MNEQINNPDEPTTQSKTKAAKPTPVEATYSKTEVESMIAKAVAEAIEQVRKESTPIQTIYVKPDEEMVTLLYLGGIAHGTTVRIGKLGNINRDGGTLDIPKREFLQGITPAMEGMMKQRRLLVVNGLTDEERERYDLCYSDNEILSVKTYYRLLDFNVKEICEIFTALCEAHRRIVSKAFLSAYVEKNDNRVTLEKVKALNAISKTTDKDGLFTPILEDMGRTISSKE